MTTSPSWRLAAASGLAVVTAILSTLCLLALNLSGEVRLGSAPLMKVAAGADRRAAALVNGPAMPTSSERREAEQLSRQALSQFPYDTSAWLRLAYVDYLNHGHLTKSGLEDLKRSYDLIAVDQELGQWRIRFALENSQSLTSEVRASVRHETSALWMNPNHRSELRQVVPTIRNPAGRLSLALWLNRLDAGVTE